MLTPNGAVGRYVLSHATANRLVRFDLTTNDLLKIVDRPIHPLMVSPHSTEFNYGFGLTARNRILFFVLRKPGADRAGSILVIDEIEGAQYRRLAESLGVTPFDFSSAFAVPSSGFLAQRDIRPVPNLAVKLMRKHGLAMAQIDEAIALAIDSISGKADQADPWGLRRFFVVQTEAHQFVKVIFIDHDSFVRIITGYKVDQQRFEAFSSEAARLRQASCE